jgi:hypothetical protein
MNWCTTTLFCHSQIGHFCHIIVNKSWICVIVFYSVRWLHLAVGTDTLLRHLQEMKCCTRVLLYYSGIGHFISYNRQWILDLYCVFHSLRWPQLAVGNDSLLRHVRGMKCCTTTHLCHSRNGHFFSYNRQWILDMCCCIPFREVAATSHRDWQLVKAPPGNEISH